MRPSRSPQTTRRAPRHAFRPGRAAFPAVVFLASCGGGGSTSDPDIAKPASDPASAEAAAVAANSDPLCNAIRPFYWEIGNASVALTSGSVGDAAPDAGTLMDVASASKWLYSSYVVERNDGILNPVSDVPFLNFTSGYSNFPQPICPTGGTVADCLVGARGTRNDAEALNAVFHYNSGHMQVHAGNNSLGLLDDATLAPTIRAQLGAGVSFTYANPQLAGGANTSAGDYAVFLRKLLMGNAAPLRIALMLGSYAVCTLPSRTCNAASSPIPAAWHYSLGHWVEDDPGSTPPGDGSFSSGGAFGFYPWVNSTRTLYGIVAREKRSAQGEGYQSAECGRVIRQAWSEAAISIE